MIETTQHDEQGKPQKRQQIAYLQVKLPLAYHKRLRIIAAERGTTMTKLTREGLRLVIGEQS